MTNTDNTFNRDDSYDLKRFTDAQEMVYERVLVELKSGRKRTHWMWFIFPQIDGLGSSATTKRYAIKSKAEAQAYLNHPLLGTRLLECTEAVLAIDGRSVDKIFDYPDHLKFLSCMTLFASIKGVNSVFDRALHKYFHGKPDGRTLQILGQLGE